jgi:nucleotide-binding universal stress UspA family protein
MNAAAVGSRSKVETARRVPVGAVAFAVVCGVWMLEALALGYVMGRRGYEAYSWTLIGVVLGPLGIALAVSFALRPLPGEPRVVQRGRRGAGTIDVLVGIDGSRAADAAFDRVVALLGSSRGRVTLARVVPFDATHETEAVAQAQLEAARAAHPELGASTVLLRGNPASTLRDFAARSGYKLLAVGTRGAGRSRAVLGSVATSLARGSEVPVLLVDDVVLTPRTQWGLRAVV